MKTILMCEPREFNVNYEINPWMNSNIGNVDKGLAYSQWEYLYQQIKKVAKVEVIKNQPKDLPDLVFTANAAFVLNNKVAIAHFSKKERQPESIIFGEFFSNKNYEVDSFFLNEDIPFEGAGDCLFEKKTNTVVISYGFRTDKSACEYMGNFLSKISKEINLIQVELINPSFYHLDTCFCPLDNGYILYYPGAFSKNSNQLFKDCFNEKLIEMTSEDAKMFACNAVSVENYIFLNNVSQETERKLINLGFQIIKTPMGEFMKSGGGAKCLTLDVSLRV